MHKNAQKCTKMQFYAKLCKFTETIPNQSRMNTKAWGTNKKSANDLRMEDCGLGAVVTNRYGSFQKCGIKSDWDAPSRAHIHTIWQHITRSQARPAALSSTMSQLNDPDPMDCDNMLASEIFSKTRFLSIFPSL